MTLERDVSTKSVNRSAAADRLSIPVPQRAASAFQVREETEHMDGAGLFQSNFYQCSAA